MGYLVTIFGWLPVLIVVMLGVYWADKSDKLCEIKRQENINERECKQDTHKGGV